ncbi:Glycosyltransferase involved in cell wall bisynthesis [Franzmannia pantelleriensis]|uniref:Glycosyltransferase involved in cell wall bisynthesis n=1 Tax=Franzmannia pantelleriensis TaxID=48727 RepID=A0A1G9ET37_9GAMM|nr:glycosyltransferase family 4 protein [Halomonas pantelleriensis]SDK79208.1 Glycosyltransferase involved in cell wall bisynthesis [Halomonas pantelleriensis]
MNILCVESYPQAIYGQQKTLLSLLTLAESEGHSVSVVCTDAGPFCNEVENLGVPVAICNYPSRLAQYGGAIYRYGLLDKLALYGQLCGYVVSLRRFILEHQFDVVFCNDMRGLLTMGVAARLCGVPVVIWDKLDKPHGMLDWFQLPVASLNVIISDAVTKKYPVWQRRFFSSRIHSISDGVILNHFLGVSEDRESLCLETQHVALAMIGSISERKAQDRLLRVVPELVSQCPEARIVLVGQPDSHSQDYYRDLPNLAHPAVTHAGFRSDMPAVMNSIDVLVILSRQEGMGLVIVEAMAAGKPVIGTRAGGIPEVVVDGETGILVEGDDDAALLDAITTLCGDAELRERMGRAGRARAEAHFDRRKQHRRVIELMESLLEKTS